MEGEVVDEASIREQAIERIAPLLTVPMSGAGPVGEYERMQRVSARVVVDALDAADVGPDGDKRGVTNRSGDDSRSLSRGEATFGRPTGLGGTGHESRPPQPERGEEDDER